MMLLAISEPEASAILLTVLGVLMGLSVLFSRAADRAGLPVVLLFMILGILGGSEGIGRLPFDDYEVAFRLGNVALVLILFDGGLNTSWWSIRRSAGPAALLATVGVFATAHLLALVGWGLGLAWGAALLIGAIVSSTDAAAVFAVLRGGSVNLKERIRSLLEVESCVNDPAAVIMTFAVVTWLNTGAAPDVWSLLGIPLQLIIGAAVGAAVGYFARWLLGRITVTTAGLYPVVTIAAAFLAFGAATLAFGSGLLAVFTAGVVLGNGPLPYATGLKRVHDSVAWMSQVSMFLMLGLLVSPSKLMDVAGVGLLLGLALALIARPVACTLILVPFRRPLKETAFASWVGLRGAVPIVLGTVPSLAGLQNGEEVFHIVFFIVVVSAIVPGASILPLSRKLKLDDPTPPTPAAALEIHSLGSVQGQVRAYFISESLAVSGAKIADIPFPQGAAAVLVVRGDELLAARGPTVLQPGDYIYVFFRPEDEEYITLLFGEAANG